MCFDCDNVGVTILHYLVNTDKYETCYASMQYACFLLVNMNSLHMFNCNCVLNLSHIISLILRLLKPPIFLETNQTGKFSGRSNHSSPTIFENTFFQKANYEIFEKI